MASPLFQLREKIQLVITAAFTHQNFNMEHIVEIMQMTRVLFDIDRIALVTNREYKYQLDLILVCSENGVVVKPGNTILLTRERYRGLMESFKNHRYEDIDLSELGEYGKDVLRSAIMQDGCYLGHVDFCSDRERSWTEDEKTALSEICYLLLVFFGLNNLKNESERFKQEDEKLGSNLISSGFFLNLVTGRCHAVKLAPFLQGKVSEWENYQRLVDDYIGYYVDPVYGQRIHQNADLDKLREALSPRTPTVEVDFPRVADGQVIWFRYAIEAFGYGENGVPEKAYFYFRDITKELSTSGVMEITKLTYVIMSAIDLETEQYMIYIDNRPDDMKNSGFMSYGSYRDLIREVAGRSIDRAYAEQFVKMFSPDHLRSHFTDNAEPLNYTFPYRTKDRTFWIKSDAIKTKHYAENGNKIVLYFSDVTEQKVNEMRLQAAKRDLENEHERVVEAQNQAVRDSLTGVYNRAGFEKAVQKCRKENIPVGLVLIDVDNFKSHNDTYGHDFGDKVLKLIAGKLQSSFRNEDKVFRMGGDEFALLLHNCNPDVWSSLQRKFEGIHNYMISTIQKEVTVTVSAGFCQSDEGYDESLFKLADEALYYTKSIGRAGLSQINHDHKILHAWRAEDHAPRNTMPELESIGRWHAQVYEDKDKRSELFLDEASHCILGIPDAISAEDCFTYWSERVVDRYRDLCNEVMNSLANGDKAEAVYGWLHPVKGEIMIRVVGRAQVMDGMTEIYGYMRELEPSKILLNHDDGRFLMQAMNRSYFCTYYFNLSTKDYFIVKGHDDEPDVRLRHKNVDVTFGIFADTFVDPAFRQAVRAFADLDTLSDRLKNKAYIDCEYLSVTALGWCRTRIMPVKWDKWGNVTHAVSMSECIDEAKQAELEKEASIRQAMKLQLRVGEIISRTNIVQTGIIDTASGDTMIWPDALFMDNCLSFSFEQMRNWGRLHVYEEDADTFDTEFELQHILAKVAENGVFEMSSRCVRDGGEPVCVSYHFEAMRDDEEKLLMVIEDRKEGVIRRTLPT